MRDRQSIETREQAAVAAFGDIGTRGEEAVLLAAARQGHPTAFGDLVEGHTRRLRRMAFRITRNREDAEDAVQECLKSALTRLSTFKGQSQFSTWLTRIAMNCALMKLRARRHDLIPLDDSIESYLSVKLWRVRPSSLTPEENYRRTELQSILAEQIARLQPKLRSALHLHLREGLMAQEAAKVLGISSCAVKARVHRARRALRIQLERLGIGKNASANYRRTGSTFPPHDRGSRDSYMSARQSCAFGD